MAELLRWDRQQQTLLLSGELNRETLLPLWQQQEALLSEISQVDVAQLSHVDSAGLALLVHWCSRIPGLRLAGMTEKLQTLMTLYNLQSVIPDFIAHPG